MSDAKDFQKRMRDMSRRMDEIVMGDRDGASLDELMAEVKAMQKALIEDPFAKALREGGTGSIEERQAAVRSAMRRPKSTHH